MSAGATGAFLRRMIDDAALFPPAGLAMDAALAQNVRSRASAQAFALGRFICPASRIDELMAHLPHGPEELAVSVTCDSANGPDWYDGLKRDLARGESLVRAAGRVRLDAIEVRLPPGDDGMRMLTRLRDDRFGASAQVEVFLEVSLEADWRIRVPQTLARIAEGGYSAKLRCGGAVAQAFPSPEQVACFIAAARDYQVRMKATAGLHHPIRHVEATSGAHMHGFLNVAGAAIFAHAYNCDCAVITEILQDEDPHNFTLDSEAFGWCEQRAHAAQIEAARRALFIAYGSCSFAEPIDDLKGLGIL